jgi:hypothetical protein
VTDLFLQTGVVALTAFLFFAAASIWRGFS